MAETLGAPNSLESQHKVANARDDGEVLPRRFGRWLVFVLAAFAIKLFPIHFHITIISELASFLIFLGYK